MEQHRFRTPGRLELALRTGAADMEITTTETEETVVEFSGVDPAGFRIELQEVLDGHVLSVEQHDGGGRRSSGGIHVRAPDGARVRVETGSGDVTSRGELGALVHRSGSGDLSFGSVAGDAVVKLASGRVRGGTVEGHLTVETASGDVEIGSVGGDLTATLASGDLRVRRARGSARVSSASGDVSLGEAATGTVTITTMSGDIFVGVSPGVTVWLDLSSVSGSATSELEPAGATAGSLELRASSVSGDVRAARAVER